MKIKQLDQPNLNSFTKKDSIDTPGCFGEFDKKERICSQYCCISIKCCVLHTRNPQIDIIEQLLTNQDYTVKLQ